MPAGSDRKSIQKNKANECNFLRLPSFSRLLLTEVQSLDDSTVTFDVNLLQVLQQLTTLTYQAQQRTLCAEVVAVVFEVLSKVVDTVRKQGNLALRRTCVHVRLAVLTEKLLLFLCC